MKKYLIGSGIIVILLIVGLIGCVDQDSDGNVVSIEDINKDKNRYLDKEIVVKGYYITGSGGGNFVSILISEVYPAKSDERQITAEIPESVGEHIDIFQGSEYYWNGTINDEGSFIINSVKPTS